MAAAKWWKMMFVVGFVSLFHAAYSAAQHRTYLRLTEKEFTSLPLDIVMQSIMSLIVAMLGIAHIAGDFKEIRATMELQSNATFNQPISGFDLARPAGIASFMRLPVHENAEGLSACFVGVALDSGTSNRGGARFGPRQIRCESCFGRPFNVSTRAAPFESMQIADIGDVKCNLYNLPEAVKEIKLNFQEILSTDCKPLTMGGDHTITYPILQAVKEKYGPVGLVHVDAHADVNDTMMNMKIAHGTPFRRAVEEGLLDCKKVVQIGLRGSGYTPLDYEWSRQQGFRVIQIEECWYKSLTPLMAEIRKQMGEHPVYISFDIDALDPGYAPGTGTPEIAGLTPIQALEIIRGCRGLNVIGGDLVEVSPLYDQSGNTALLAANLLFEMLCILPGVKYY